ncbi:MAG TPA: LLM class flavin-dependent oxidoreductase [Phototrophicaceae bacterium]|nr:LLM class flavin-dependent oxidoreductase [Phototrophicaceae bacterium]
MAHPHPTFGIMFRCQYPPEQLITFARQAETAGFDELWIVEDCFFAGGIASTTVALASTQTITVGLGIMPAVARNPAFVAMEIAVLARFYPGRLLPGFGHGVADWMRQVGAFPTSQLKALEEVTYVVRELLAGKTVGFSGQHVQLDQVKLDFPPDVIPPVALGVRGPKSLQMSGRVADGTIIPEGSSPAYVAWTRQQIDAGKTDENRPHRLTVYAWVSVDQDGPASRQRLRPVLAGMLTGSEINSQIDPLGIVPEVKQMLERGGRAELEQHMPDAWINELAIAGTPQECAAAVRRLIAAGADAIVFVPPLDQGREQLDLIAREVLPLVR